MCTVCVPSLCTEVAMQIAREAIPQQKHPRVDQKILYVVTEELSVVLNSRPSFFDKSQRLDGL